MLGGGKARIRTFHSILHVLALASEPIAEIRENQLKTVVIHQCVEAIFKAIPDVPNKWQVEYLAMLLKELIAKPHFECR